MTLKFKTRKEAREYLISTGYVFDGYGQLTKNEMYRAGALIAMLKGTTVKIR